MPRTLVYGLGIDTGHVQPGPCVAGGHDADVVPDPAVAAVTRVALSTTGGDIVFDGFEADILADLDHALAGLEPGVLVTWNGSGFDLPYLADRAELRRIRLGLHLAPDPRLANVRSTLPGHDRAYRAAWYQHRHLDAARLFRSGRRPLIDVEELLRVIGLPLRGRTATARSTPGDDLAHDVTHAYATNDARLVRCLVEARLPGIVRQVDRVRVPPERLTSAPMSSAPASSSGPRRPLGAGLPLSAAHPAVRSAFGAMSP